MQLFSWTRESTALDGTWQLHPDQYRKFEEHDIHQPEEVTPPRNFDPDDGLDVPVPGSFNAELTDYSHYEGLAWHTRRFEADPDDAARTFLRFGAVNYRADVWLNGEKLGAHEGGYTPFSFDVTDVLESDNYLAVAADNERREDGVPELVTDWYNFGGIQRSVELVAVPETFVRNFKVETALIDDAVRVSIRAWLDGPDEPEITARLPELDATVALEPDQDGYAAEVTFDRSAVDLWTPDDPRLYDLEIEAGEDTVSDRVGLREIEARDGEIRLNGESIWLRGISLHEEAYGRGRALTDADVRERFDWIEELGCNFARLAHYPHTEKMARMADERGILLWEEVPAYWSVNFGDPEIQALIEQQLREVVQRDWNRASVALWSVANETDPDDEVRTEVLSELVAATRGHDDSRPITAACDVSGLSDDAEEVRVDDPLAEHLDVIGINQYYGWYYGEADDMQRFEHEGKPVIVSETGGGAKWGHHGDPDERWTEEFQAELYRGQISAFRDHDGVAGMTPWILFDFQTPIRMNPHQRGWNLKGIRDRRGRKKEAFHVLREFYEEQASE